MSEKETILDRLSRSEKIVHDYIKEKSDETEGHFKQSMSKISKSVGVSEATVHRAIRRLKKDGIIGIIPSQDKTESNEIIYYGIPDEEEEVNSILTMASDLNSSLNRFQALMQAKDETIRSMEKERNRLLKQLQEQEIKIREYSELSGKLQEIVADYERGNKVLQKSRIVGYTKLDDHTSALIYKEK